PGRGPYGDVRAFDVRTGREAWRFHTVPRPGEAGHDTWAGDSWRDRMGANVWSIMSVDVERGMVFLPIGSPAADFYGGDRHGANLYGNSLVALDAATGRYLWHFQMVHHDLWDYDLPAPPVLSRQKVTRDDLSNVTPESADECRSFFDRAASGAIFRPPSLKPSIQLPGLRGGGNWGGGALDPATGLLYVGANEDGDVINL